MSRELKVYGMPCNVIRIIRLMRHQNGRFVGRDVVQRLIQVCRLSENIIDAGKPEPSTVSFDWYRLIDQHRNPLPSQRAGDAFGIGEHIVVPEHSPDSVRSL